LFTSVYLSNIRAKAIRRRVLYRCLDVVERGILYLASRVVDDVRSSVLVEQLMLIVKKLGAAMMSGFMRHVESFGAEQVRKIVDMATGFGSVVACEWLKCTGFSKYLSLQAFSR
jgi:hypothetical protein